ncbi:MAG: hypothetical protein ACREOO_21655 [bacterium]
MEDRTKTSGEQSLINPVKNALDSRLSELCQSYANSDMPARARIRASISMDEFYTLLTFGRRAAVFALRERSVNWIIHGLTAIAMIESERIDFRDAVLDISLLYHAATKIGENPDKLLQDAATLSEDNVAELLTGFVKRPREEKDLKSSWGYDEVQTKDGAGFIGWAFGEYNPTLDLKSIVLEVAELISSDKYQPEFVEVASELAPVWLESKDNPSVHQALRSVLGGAGISGRLRPNAHPTYESQTLMISVLELSNESAAQELLDMSKRKRPLGYCMFGLAKQKLFCLVVARSFEQGVETFETPESLLRFTEGIEEIMIRFVGKN